MSNVRRQYPFHLIEPKWQQYWDKQQTFRAWNPGETLPSGHPFAVRHGLEGKAPAAAELPPKYYILDMFPYPSGAGLHVGHPEGYTATDILARYRRAQGANVLHPMGWDAFGLPAEQYAVKTGRHPRITTEENVANFTKQIKSLGFSYDWSREVDTTDPKYFRWTQWIFLQLYNAWFNPETNKAEPISTLKYPSDCSTEEQKRAFRDSKRLAFVSEAPVNWCPELGTVLANEEVIDGKSEVGGYPVIRRPMRQWMLRITAFAEKLLNDLDGIDWSHSLKEMQRNWIGKSEGAEVDFKIADCGFQVGAGDSRIRVFTTRPDTLFGATYMVLSPEHKLIDQMLQFAKAECRTNEKIVAGNVTIFDPNGRALGIKSLAEALELVRSQGVDLIEVSAAAGLSICVAQDQAAFRLHKAQLQSHMEAVQKYRDEVSRKSDMERTELAKEKTGVFTGAYAINPVNGEKIPIWIADYVLATYGTGAIMAVPAHDERDFDFAKKFALQIVQVVRPPDAKTDWQGFVDDGTAVNSAGADVSLNGLPTQEAKKKITAWLEAKGFGKKTINYKLRDWLFSRQRYWGEPFPIIWKKDASGNLYHEALPESALPLLPPTLEDYKPTAEGQPPLARAKDWVNLPDGSVREVNTMPQWAGSCWYYLRYLDALNAQGFCGTSAESYWMGTAGRGTMVEGREPDLRQPSSLDARPSTPGVDLYVGGTEHAVLHLLYARFWHKVLFDLGHVSTPEPFFKLVNQGLILGEMEYTTFTHPDGTPCSTAELRGMDEEATPEGLKMVALHRKTGDKFYGRRVDETEVEKAGDSFVLKSNHAIRVDARSFKMSKSRGNVINPDAILKDFGADALRLYEMFMGPLEMVKPWSTKGVEGVYRFLGRVWRLFVDENSEVEFEQKLTLAQHGAELLTEIKLHVSIKDAAPTPAQLKALHACIKKVTDDLDHLRFNTAISTLMIFINDAITWETKPVSALKTFLQLLAPLAPHLAEELWQKLHAQFPAAPIATPSLTYSTWPKFDPAVLVESTLEIPVQVNGKLRDRITVAAAASQAEIEATALASEKVQQFMEGKPVKKIIVIPKKLVNIVV